MQVLLDLVNRRNDKGHVQHHKETEEYGNTHRIRHDAKAMANGEETQGVHAIVLPTQSPSAEVRHVNADRQERIGQPHKDYTSATRSALTYDVQRVTQNQRALEDVRAANANHATRDFTNPHSHERNEANQEGLAVHVLVATLLHGDRTWLDEGVHAHHDHGQRNDNDERNGYDVLHEHGSLQLLEEGNDATEIDRPNPDSKDAGEH